MFGTLGFSELIIILVIILIIFGAGRLPQIGEGVGKALKGFKKEVHEAEPVAHSADVPVGQEPPPIEEAQVLARASDLTAQAPTASTPYRPGPELTPGTTASLMAAAAPQIAQPRAPSSQTPTTPATVQTKPADSSAPPSMEQRMSQPPPAARGVYPPLPASAQSKPAAKRPSVVVNKDAVARVQAQQAALRAQGTPNTGVSPQDMQGLGESLGGALRTFRQAAADVRNSIDPEMRTIRAEMDAAQKEIEQSIEAAKEMPAVQEDPPKSS